MKAAVLLSLGVLALAAPAPQPQPGHKLAFSRKRHESVTRDDGTVDLDELMSQLKFTLLKYNKDYELPEALKNHKPQTKRAFTEHLIDQTEGGEDELYVFDLVNRSSNKTRTQR